MGRNNRARRQQKQNKQRKRNKIKQQSSSALKNEELERIVGPVVTALEFGEPPPPSLMQLWSTGKVSDAAEDLRRLLLGFVDYLFHKGSASGQLECLISYKKDIRKTRLGAAYPLLYSYCLLNEKSLIEGDSRDLALQFNSDWLAQQMMVKDYASMQSLCAPFYLFFWATGIATTDKDSRELELWLGDCLYQSNLKNLIKPLTKFLKLKAPDPKQKTVIALEKALIQTNWDNEMQWRKGLGMLLQLFLEQRLTVRQLSKERWSDCPHLARLAGLFETQVDALWSNLQIVNADTATLNMLDKFVDKESMHYQDRARLEALKCRILAEYAHPDSTTFEDFNRQLSTLINLLSTGIPPAQTEFAKLCLDALCEWLADQVSYGKLPDLTLESLQRIHRQRPNDYRILVLIHWVTGGRASASQRSTSSFYQNIHSDLFFFVFNNEHHPTKFLKDFYWALTSEVKKDLFIRSCRQLFLQASTQDTHEQWSYYKNWLFDTKADPFDAVLRGHPCEHEFLFYVVIALVDKPTMLNFIQTAEMTALVRFCAELLTKNASDFNQTQMTRLLNLLSEKPAAISMFNTWEPVLSIVGKIQHMNTLEAFILLATKELNKKQDRNSEKYLEMHKAINKVPKARALSRGYYQTTRQKRNKTAISANYELFDDLS